MDEIQRGASPTLSELDTLRKVAGAAAKSQNADDRRMARVITGKIDDFIDNLDPKRDVFGGDTEAGAASIKQARELWSRYSKSDQIEQLFEKAINNAPGTPAEGFEGQLRKQFKTLANNPNRMRRFSADEQDAIKQVARGSKLQNGLTKLGKFSPTAGFFALLVAGHVGLDALANPELLAVPAIGSFARYAAGKLRERAAQKTSQMVRGGKPAAAFFNKRSQLRGSALGGALRSGAGIDLSTLPGALLPSENE
jgi:hypothetical protein